MKRLVLLIFFLFFLFCQGVSAATLNIQNAPATINESDEFSVDVSLACSGCSDSYLRGVLYDNGTSYFGYTQDNSGNFSNATGSNCTTFFKISQADLVAGSWSGKIKFKPDPNSSNYKGSGEYSFKVGRYTSSCSSPSVWSNEVVVSIIGPTSTPTSVPSAASSFSPTKSPTPSPTLVLIPKVTSKSVKGASTSVTKAFATLSATPSNLGSNIGKASVLGESQTNKNRLILIITLLLGAVLFIIAAGIIIKKYWREIIEWLNI